MQRSRRPLAPRRWTRAGACGLILTLATACSSANTEATTTRAQTDPPPAAEVSRSEAKAAGQTRAPVAGEAVAYFAGGCFWGVEYFLEKIPGVISVESGYMGGHIDNPSYEQVLGHQTGHLESVKVRYDPAKVDYEAIARRFFEIHDPTQANGQGPDIGPQYLSAVFVANDDERATVDALIGQLEDNGYDVVTEVKPVTEFFDAEDYHQDYYVKHDKKPYCHAPVDRFKTGS